LFNDAVQLLGYWAAWAKLAAAKPSVACRVEE
jgi:hypothetical protein